jgi:hypothetical protein
MQEMDWNSVFAPTVRCTPHRLIIALAAHHDYELEQLDVVTAFLKADVISAVYMYQTQGSYKTGKNGG